MLIYQTGLSNSDLWILPLDGSRPPFPYLNSSASESEGHFSPDQRFIAYVSNETGQSQIYVRPFQWPPTDTETPGKWTISAGGGTAPRWRGNRLFYVRQDGHVMAVDAPTTPTFNPGKPKVLFKVSAPTGWAVSSASNPAASNPWDVDRDGSRFLVPELSGDSLPFTLILNWNAGLKP